MPAQNQPPGVPDDLPTPVPISSSTTPGGTSRPRATMTTLDEAAHLRDIAQVLSTSQEVPANAPPPPDHQYDAREERYERRFARLEGGMSALLQSQARQLDIASASQLEQKKNTVISQRSSTMATVAAYSASAIAIFVALAKAFAEFGVQNPGAPLTTTAVLLIVARAVAGLKMPPVASSAEPTQGPPPGHT